MAQEIDAVSKSLQKAGQDLQKLHGFAGIHEVKVAVDALVDQTKATHGEFGTLKGLLKRKNESDDQRFVERSALAQKFNSGLVLEIQKTRDFDFLRTSVDELRALEERGSYGHGSAQAERITRKKQLVVRLAQKYRVQIPAPLKKGDASATTNRSYGQPAVQAQDETMAEYAPRMWVAAASALEENFLGVKL